jgi:hypothetical protein
MCVPRMENAIARQHNSDFIDAIDNAHCHCHAAARTSTAHASYVGFAVFEDRGPACDILTDSNDRF